MGKAKGNSLFRRPYQAALEIFFVHSTLRCSNRRDRDMQYYGTRCLTGGLGAFLALVLTAPVAEGGTMSPSDSTSLFGEVSAFVGDFGQWNASMNNLPLEFWEMAPSSDKAEAGVVLFWFWLLEGRGGSQGDSSSAANSPPSGSGTSGDPPIGTILSGKPGDGSSSHFGKNEGDDPPGVGGSNGNSSLGSDGSSRSPSSDALFLAGSGNQPNPNGLPLPGSSSGGSGATPSASDPVPEPTTLTLLGVGGVGLLMGRWMRRRFA